jgi:Xaa-Pro aminopeptidase
MARMPKNSIALIPTAPEPRRYRDTCYPFRHESDFYYLTGYPEENALAVLIPKHPAGEYWLFNQEKNPEKEQWTGPRPGQEGALKHYGAHQAYPIDTFPEHILSLLENKETIIYPIGQYKYWDKQICDAIYALEKKGRAGVSAPQCMMRLSALLHEMRLFKSQEEVTLLQKAAEISAKAHLRAMEMCKPGLKEYEIEAEIIRTFMEAGARQPAYSSIVAAGKNACVLHYTHNQDTLKDGELLLIDAGAEYQFYAGDITRTFPINGRFTAAQKAIYEIVLAAQMAALAKAKPGNHWLEPHEAVIQTITEGLVNLEILSGPVSACIEQEAYKPFFMHRTGHWLGMDVHDVGDYKKEGAWRPLETGMVFTVEPGLYIQPSSTVDSKWWNIGIRIEDDILITEDGHLVLTKAVPKTIPELETIVGSKKR